MQKVSSAYKKQIKKVPFRNRSFAEVIVGIVNKEAQREVAVVKDIQYMDYSNFDLLFTRDDIVESEYATYELNYFRPDGSMSYVGSPYTNQGIVSKNFGENIKFDLGKEYTLAGLTITFGSKFPTQFNLLLDNQDPITINITDRRWEYVTPITTRYITIQPITYNRGTGRTRIESFKCGYYKLFRNNDLIGVSYDETISPISDELSQNGLTVKVENFGRKFDVELEKDLTRFFEVGQDVNVIFMYELDDGTLENVDLGNLSLKSWEIDSTTLILKGTSYINTLDDTCMIGEYSEEGKTLYDLAVEVFEDLGLTSGDYSIDTRMKNFTTHNPLPQLPHSQLLQILANAGQCAVLRDRKNMYKIIPTAFINDDDVQFNITDNGHTPNSTPNKIIDIENSVKTNYIADFSLNYFRIDGEMWFSGNDNQGYISSMLSNASGSYATNPRIEINVSKPLQFTGFTIDFIDAIPQLINISSYYNNEFVYSEDFEVNERQMPCQSDFGYCDKIVLTILKGSPNARVHIAQMLTPPIVFTFTTDRDVIGSPKAKIEDAIKFVELETTSYTPQESQEDAFKQEITIENGLDYSNWEVIFNSPIIPNKFYVNDVEITPISFTGQHCIVDLSSYAEDDVLDFRVSGKQLTTKNKTYRTQLKEKGLTNSYQNPMIDNDKLAKENLIWLGIYNSFDKEYTIQSRGYPELESNDLVGLEIPQLELTTGIRLTSQKITFDGGGLRGTNIGLRENVSYLNQKPKKAHTWQEVLDEYGNWQTVLDTGTWQYIYIN